MLPNTNPETGIRYGIISQNSIDPWIIDRIFQEGRDVHWEERMAEIRDEVMGDDDVAPDDKEDEIDLRIEREGDRWCDDEPVREFEIDGVFGQTTWLGGGQLLWVFKSPFISNFDLCSPCVPNAGNLDNPSPHGYQTYDVPPDWRMNHDNT